MIALGFDAADRRVPFSFLGTGLLDEPAHLATAALGLLVLACFIDAPRRFYVAALIASVAIDLDHVPLYLGLLGSQGQRPVTHSFGTVLLFAGAAVAIPRHRAVFAGVGTGLVLHFVRDIAEGPPGVRMLWPLQQTAWTASYWWFLGMIVTFTVVRLGLMTAGVRHTRACLFRQQAPHRSAPHGRTRSVTPGDRIPASGSAGPDPAAQPIDAPHRSRSAEDLCSERTWCLPRCRCQSVLLRSGAGLAEPAATCKPGSPSDLHQSCVKSSSDADLVLVPS